ncbi:VOC family protein [Cellulomonas sp. P22]|uniref:VOC family protein n=1 Tax=Cellulomonas sp. P22 TaxID=3373189 RepID=UPI00379E0F87
MGIVRPHLWYHEHAEEAARFYVSVIPRSEITNVVTAPEGVPGTEPGSAFIVEFTLDGMPVTAISAGPSLTLNAAFSFLVECDTQDEIDHYWDALVVDGGEHGQCGWLTDRFGLSWQVAPRMLGGVLFGPDPAGAARATEAMLAMTKLDIAAVQAAYDGV